MLAAVSSRAITIDDVARAAQVSPATVSRVRERHARRVARPGRASAGRRRRARLPAVRSRPSAPPPGHRRLGSDRRRHREPVLHVDRPRHRRRGTRARVPSDALQLRRGPPQGGRLHRRRDLGAHGGRRHRGRVDTRASRLDPLRDAGIPIVAVDRRPERPQRSTACSSTTSAARRTRPRHLIEVGARADRVHHRPPACEHRDRAAQPATARRLRHAGRRADPVARRAAGLPRSRRVQGDARAVRAAASHPTRCSSPTTS